MPSCFAESAEAVFRSPASKGGRLRSLSGRLRSLRVDHGSARLPSSPHHRVHRARVDGARAAVRAVVARSTPGGVLLGVTGYTPVDVHFSMRGYLWLAVWYACGVGEMIFVEQVVDSVRMTTWSRSYYQNVCAAAPLTLIALATNEAGHVTRASFTPTAVAVLLASCVAGLVMSYYSFALRSVISATSFSDVGNVCKVGTILVSCLELE